MKLKNNLSDFELDLYDFESNFVRFAALCLPFGLPFGREHCVVPREACPLLFCIAPIINCSLLIINY